MSNHTRTRLLVGAAIVLALAGGVPYFMDDSQASGEIAAPAPAIPVTVETLQLQKVRVWSEFSGRLHAVDSADIRPEVSGRITEVQQPAIGQQLFDLLTPF